MMPSPILPPPTALSDPPLVLVVDDEEQNRQLLRDPLEARGYRVAEATNGEEALDLAAATPPDVILLDLMMPRLDGFATCRRFKLNDATAHVPVLLVTALTERQERLTGIQAGANDFLTKPVDLQDVILRVGNAVHVKRLYDQLKAERERSELLLRNILPEPIADRMKNGETNLADSFPEVTVLLADIVGFTQLATHIGPDQIVFLLNEVFSGFDLLADKHQVEKIKTIGDAYLAAAGGPFLHTDPALAVAALALDMRAELDRFNHDYNTSIRVRIAINTGPLVAGVIGRHKFAYDIWGETVNLVWRLEEAAGVGDILLAPGAYQQLQGIFRFGPPQRLELRDCGPLTAHPLLGTVESA